MKRLFSISIALHVIACAVILLLFSLSPALAQPAPVTKFSGVGTGTTTLSYFVSTANGVGSAIFKVVDATTDATNQVQFYSAASPLSVTGTSASGQAVIKAVGSSVSASDVIVVRSVANDTYQRLVVSASTTTNITATANLSFGLVTGDRVYKMTKAGSVPVVATNRQLDSASGYLYAGAQGKPVLVEIAGTSACALNLVTGTFEK